MPNSRFPAILLAIVLSVVAPASLFAGILVSDLAITKTDGAASSIPGDTVTYTIVATNNGPNDAIGADAVTVTDTFPAELSGCTWTCVASAGSTCTAAGVGNIADSADLLNGGTATYTATCDIDPAATGTLDNTATVASANTDPTPADNSATDSNSLTPTSDLTVTKTDGAASSIPGDTVTYTIVATNNGPSDATAAAAVTVTDTFPAELSGCTWTCAAAAGSTCTAAGVGDLADSADLLSGGTATYTATCDIDPAATGTLDNTATVTSTNTDPTPADNSATDSNSLAASADLSVSLTVDPPMPTAGESFTIMVTVVNNGPSDAANTSVDLTLPGGLTVTGTTGCAEDPNGVPTCSLGTITAGGNTTYEVIVEAAAALDGQVTAVVSSDATDPVPVNDETTVDLSIASVAEIPVANLPGLALFALLLGLVATGRILRG